MQVSTSTKAKLLWSSDQEVLSHSSPEPQSLMTLAHFDSMLRSTKPLLTSQTSVSHTMVALLLVMHQLIVQLEFARYSLCGFAERAVELKLTW